MKPALWLFLEFVCLIVMMTSCVEQDDDVLPMPQEGPRYLNPIFPLYNRYTDIPYGANMTQAGKPRSTPV